MKIEILQGTEKRLYDLVAPLVLNPSVIRQNNGVAFKTATNHIWIVAVSDDGACIGFLPVQKKGNTGEINNYHIQNRDEKLLKLLMRQVIKLAKKQKFEAIDIIAQKHDYKTVLKFGFISEKEFVKYTRFKKIL
ncbi:MAG: hypothetical protein LBB90_12075 [Tannerella sp.]|jgi:predicted GNAT family N-acyltransferase|nr:hypothetical protein [Tannerella sp.]